MTTKEHADAELAKKFRAEGKITTCHGAQDPVDPIM
jgi:hypothetical protein